MKIYDIAVVGGGASGLMAAVTAGKQKKAVVLLEGNQKLGKKLLATGNGRCNLTNLKMSPSHYYGDTGELEKLLAMYSAERIAAEFKSLGLLLYADEEGRVYPNNLQAAAVLQILAENCAEEGVDCLCDFNVFSAIHSGNSFVLKSVNGGEIRAKKLILATGGMASPKHSSGKDGYAIAQFFGHSLTPLYPVLTQFTTRDKFIASLGGVRCKAKVSLVGDGKILSTQRGELLFADKAVSGICIFELSVLGGEFFALGTIQGEEYRGVSLQIDFCPKMTAEEIMAFLTSLIQKRPAMAAENLLEGLLNLKISREIIRSSGIHPLTAAQSLTQAQLHAVVTLVKALSLSITGVKDWQNAQVTAGGVPLSQISVDRMESKLRKDLYLTGELLNVHGNCGGYNLHWAWLTGMIAGQMAAEERIIL
ncbi:MAG: aminoacetone oxidase family FAD-binding enzyme [Oscillospiraceae bacterium]